MTDQDSRRAELAEALVAVRQRIVTACAAAGRDPSGVTLIAITKTFPASDVRLLAGLGVSDVGENRNHEAAAKHEELQGLRLRWHFVGQVQSRKAATVAAVADVVHSVDRIKLVHALDRAAGDLGRPIRVLVQVRLDRTVHGPDASGPGTSGPGASGPGASGPGASGPDRSGTDSGAGATGGRGGAAPSAVADLAAAIASTENLQLGGLMAVAPVDADPAAAFAQLADIAARVRSTHPGATDISAGMSGDLEAAVTAGATHLRVGSALLGRRPALG